MQENKNKIEKILVIRTHRIGDILQITPMLRGLREKYPHAKISLLVEEGFCEVVQKNPDIDEVIPFSRIRFSDEILASKNFPWGVYRDLREWIRELRQRRFDLVINRQFTDPESILTYLIDPVEARGKVMDGDGELSYADPVTARVVEQTMTHGRNSGLKNLVDLSIDVAGAVPSNRALVFSVDHDIVQSCRERLTRHGFSLHDRFFGIQAGASRAYKKLGSRSLAAAVDHLVESLDYKILFFGSREERSMGEEILKEVQTETSHVLNLMGETSLEELGGFLSGCDFLLSGDTGTVHVAAAVGTKTISTSYGMTYPYETAPYGPGHLILYADLPCAPCDDPNHCSYEMACERILLPKVLIPGIEAALALAEGDEERVKRVIEDPQLQGVRVLYTGKGPVNGDIKLYDLKEKIPTLEEGSRPTTKKVDPSLPQYIQMLAAVHKSVEQIRADIDAGLTKFSSGEKVQGFQAILPIFDSWSHVIRRIAEIEHERGGERRATLEPIARLHERLLPVLQHMGQAMEKMDLATIQDILFLEIKPIAEEEEELIARILHE